METSLFFKFVQEITFLSQFHPDAFLWRAKALFNTKFKNNTKLKKNNTKLRDNTKLKKNNTKLEKNNTKLKK